ncbi:MAG: aconitase X catalytic domain-containing protein [Oscillospiraceae bacterium]|nr:aconitase X catalytic domain-containing protein [Oscillospiraceae bacterium]
MVRLTEYEKKMLDGELGELKQKALANIIKYAEAVGVDELCEVTKATVFMGAQPYLDVVKSDDYEVVFSKMHMCSDKVMKITEFDSNCTTQNCAAPCCQYLWEPINLTEEYFKKNNRNLEIVKEAGVNIAGSCSPYLTGWIPVMGEHFVTSESSNVLMCNSVFAARGNSDGIEATTWSAVCGRTPKWGYHVAENRLASHVFNISCKADTVTEWDVLGYTIGRKLQPGDVPVLVFPDKGQWTRPDLVKLKQFFSTLATSSGAEMCHIVGITPEALTLEMALGGREAKGIMEITQGDYDESFAMLCDPGNGPINLVSLGCPHYTLQEIRETAYHLQSKKVKEGVRLLIWTDYSTKAMADVNGFTNMITEAGGYLMTSSCLLQVGKKSFADADGIVVDSGKQAHYIRSETDSRVYYADKLKCVDAAVAGAWRE